MLDCDICASSQLVGTGVPAYRWPAFHPTGRRSLRTEREPSYKRGRVGGAGLMNGPLRTDQVIPDDTNRAACDLAMNPARR
jgi:hypothetical protein